jgi:hypothetical protein
MESEVDTRRMADTTKIEMESKKDNIITQQPAREQNDLENQVLQVPIETEGGSNVERDLKNKASIVGTSQAENQTQPTEQMQPPEQMQEGDNKQKEEMTMMAMMMQAAKRALGVADYAYDDVRSIYVHVLLYLTVFFGVFDAYLNISQSDVPNAALLFIYLAIVIVVTIGVYPLYFGNHVTLRREWLFFTFIVFGAVAGVRLYYVIIGYSQQQFRVKVWTTIECIFAVAAVISVVVLEARLYCSRNFMSYRTQRDSRVRKAKAQLFRDGPTGYIDEQTIEQVRSEYLQRDFRNLLWPTSLLMKRFNIGRGVIAFPSKLMISSLLTIAVSVYLSTILFDAAYDISNDSSSIITNLKAFESAATTTCIIFVRQPTVTSTLNPALVTSAKLACSTFVGQGSGGPNETTTNWLGYTITTFEQTGFAITTGLQVGAILSLVYALYASVVTFQAFQNLFVLHHHSVHYFDFRTEHYPYAQYFRFIALFTSNIVWGMLFITFISGFLAFIFSLPGVQAWFRMIWPSIVTFFLYILLDTFIISRFILPRFVVIEDSIKSPQLFRFLMLGLDLFYLPYSLTAGFVKTLMLLMYGILGLMRPDLNILPTELERFDRSHLAYITMVKFHHREIYGLKTRTEFWNSYDKQQQEKQVEVAMLTAETASSPTSVKMADAIDIT